ncbi:MAG: OmpH/Skp family outer membrane protein [Elusimicrobiota bacterium]
MKTRLWLSTVLALALGARAGAIEISLEQNRTEHSSIGFVDMQRLFAAFPDTQRAKQSFQEVLEKTQEQMNQRKADILRLKNKLADLNAQRQELMQAQQAPAPAPIQPAVAASSAPAVSSAPPAALARPAVLGAVVPSSAAYQARASTAAAVFPALPGVPSEPIVKTAPLQASVPTVPIALSTPAVVLSTPIAARVSAPPPVLVTPIAQLPPASRQSLAAIDSEIAVMDQEIKRDENDFKARETNAEKNLISLEGEKTDVLLGRINQAISVVAARAGISVVVDKGNILYGHNAVDLTDGVLKELEHMK